MADPPKKEILAIIPVITAKNIKALRKDLN